MFVSWQCLNLVVFTVTSTTSLFNHWESGCSPCPSWARANKTFEFLSKHKLNEKRKSVCWRGTYMLFGWKQSMYSKSHANKHKLVTFLIPERRQAKNYYAKDYKRSCLGSEIKGRNSWNLTTCTNTQNRLKVRTVSRIWQKRNKNTPYALSNEKE